MNIKNIAKLISCAGIMITVLSAPRTALSQNPISEINDMSYFAAAYSSNYDSLLHSYYFRKSGQSIQHRYQLGPSSQKVDFETVTDSVIYQRLLSLNTKIPLEYNPIVRGYVAMYLKKMNHSIDITLSLAEYYFPMFEEVLDKYGVPCELKYLAIIESALNPNAVSKAGATGLWQFMFQTGKTYDLEVGTFVDERRDPLKSTHAAARYLRDLNKIYNNWPLAIAAYNCGPGNVNKAIARSGGERSFWGIYNYLPRETRGYIPAYIAAVYMMNFYSKHGITPTHISIPTANDTIVVHQDMDFCSVAKYVDISIEELRTLNPQYKLSFIPKSEKGYPLRLPHNKTITFLKFQDSIYSHSRDSLLNSAVKEWRSVKTITHVVRRNETVGKVASKYGVSAADVKRWNHLSKKSKLKAGQRLIIYKKTSVVTSSNNSKETETKITKNTTDTANAVYIDTLTLISDTITYTATKNEKTTERNSTPTTRKTAKSADKTVRHTVKSGENLFRIARKYNTTVDKIKKDNNLKSDNINVGKVLIIKK